MEIFVNTSTNETLVEISNPEMVVDSASSERCKTHCITFKSGKDRIRVELDAVRVSILLHLLKQLSDTQSGEYTITNAETENLFRKPAQFFRYIDDHSIQEFMREIGTDDLITFLWYMNDQEINQKTYRNMSKKAAELLQDDLTSFRYSALNPNNCMLRIAIKGRTAVHEALSVYAKLIENGKIV